MTRTAAVAAAVIIAAACGGNKLRTRTDAVHEIIATARDNGAMLCAPVELAMAQSHAEFATQELDEGRYYAARDELAVAEQNARQALHKSPKARCAPDVLAEPAPGDADGDGILDDVDECPRRPEDVDGFQDEDGCPEDDNDADGLADTIDECPNDPEDKDGFADSDGCPDDDNDGDGLADAIDQCPNEAEDPDGHEDDDGCPDCDNDGDGVPECPEVVDRCPGEAAPDSVDGCPQKYQLVVVKEDRIELKQTIFFDTNRATIKPISYPLLNEVAQALGDHASIVVSIEGHTDSRGSAKHNLTLSRNRAHAVRDYLIAQGVDPARMTAKGFGEDVPIADNRTKAGRELNRRVEFVIVRR